VGLFGRVVHAAVRDEAAARDAVPRRLEERGVRLFGIDAIVPSLEDVFIASVRGEGGAPVG
jgi:drug efflux transport system ATP-binding protein